MNIILIKYVLVVLLLTLSAIFDLGAPAFLNKNMIDIFALNCCYSGHYSEYLVFAQIECLVVYLATPSLPFLSSTHCENVRT